MVLVGDSGVGKSCLLKRFASKEWDPQYISTIGVDFEILNLTVHNKNVRLQIWDTAGQERFQNITTSYYRGAHAIMVVYDVTSEDSFNSVRKWLSAVETYCTSNVSVMLVGNKSDLTDDRQVQWDTAQQFAESLQLLSSSSNQLRDKAKGIPILETSAKANVNVTEAFTNLAENAVYNILNKGQPDDGHKVKLKSGGQEDTNKKPSGGSWCCGFF